MMTQVDRGYGSVGRRCARLRSSLNLPRPPAENIIFRCLAAVCLVDPLPNILEQNCPCAIQADKIRVP